MRSPTPHAARSSGLTLAALGAGAAAAPFDFYMLFQASWLPAPRETVTMAAVALLFVVWAGLTVGAFRRREPKAWRALIALPLVGVGPLLVVTVVIGCMMGSCI